MSLYYDPQNNEEDLTHSWGTNTIINPESLVNLDSTRVPPQHTYIKSERTQPGTYVHPTEFLPVTSTHNGGPTYQRGSSSLGFDPSLTYISGEYGNPLQNQFFSNNAVFSMQGSQHNQPVLSYAQQLLSYNRKYPNLSTELAQDDPSLIYPEYLLLDDHNAYNSLPYGDWVIRQAQQNFPPPIMNAHPINAGYTMNNPYQPDNTQTEISQNSTKENEEPATPHKVSMSRAAKQRKDPKCDPRLIYGDNAETRAPWGSKTWEDGQHLFSYTNRGQWLRDRKFNNEQLREYVDNCPKGAVFRVQQAPTQCNFRLDPEDRICRWANCPVANRTITSGWLRVCFDEFPLDTSSGKRDPLLCAGSMHLWCFEQVFDPVEFHREGRLKAETRQFVHEERNVTSLEKLTDVGIVQNAYVKWFEEWEASFDLHRKYLVPREYKDTLSHKLNESHLKNQSDARARAREIRHGKKTNKGGPQRTIDIHKGDLQLYVALTNEAKGAKRFYEAKRAHEAERTRRPPETRGRKALSDDGFDSPDTSRIRIPPPPVPRAKKVGNPERMASYLPIDPALGSPSSHPLQTERRSPRGSHQKRTSPRRLKKEFRRHALATQPLVDRDHNLSMTSSSSTSTGYLNTNSTPASSFGPSSPACSTLPSSNLQLPLKFIVPPSHDQGSFTDTYTSIYPQAMPVSGFSMEDLKQSGHPLGPPLWQCHQQQFSSTAALPYVKAEHQPVFPDCDMNTQPEVSRGNDSVESFQNETKTWTEEAAEEASKVLGDSEGTNSNDSSQFKGLGPEETSIYHFLIIDEDVPESTQNPVESSNGAMDNFAAQTQTNAAASQPLELVACTESPQVAAVTEPWHSAGSFMDSVNYGGYSNTDIFPLFDDSIATA